MANVVNRALLEKIFGKISINTVGYNALLYVLQYSLKWGGVKVIYHWHLNDKLQYYRSIPWMKIHWNWNVPPIFFYQCVDRIVKLFCFVLCFVLFGVFFLTEASLWQIVRTRIVPATNRPYMRPALDRHRLQIIWQKLFSNGELLPNQWGRPAQGLIRW